MTAKQREADFNPRALQTFFITFPFGTRHEIGMDRVPMWNRWVEVRASTRAQANGLAAERFGDNYQINGEDGFPESRRRFYPHGCCLVLHDFED
jgi:hypothetical protein